MRLIDADVLKKEVDNFPNCYNGWSDTYDKAYIIEAIEEAPTIEPKRGEWIDEADKYDASFGIHDYRCSNCNSYADEYIGGHEWYTVGKPNFCPHCGADMRERKESE